MKKLLSILLCTITAFTLSSCGFGFDPLDVNTSKALTDEEKVILSASDLPTEYSQLTPTQKKTLETLNRISQMLTDKYGQVFICTNSINEDGKMDWENLTFYPADLSEVSSFHVRAYQGLSGWAEEDDYAFILAEYPLVDTVHQHIESFLLTPNQVFVEIESLDEIFDQYSGSDVMAVGHGTIYVFVKDGAESVENHLKEWLATNKSDFKVIAVDVGDDLFKISEATMLDFVSGNS